MLLSKLSGDSIRNYYNGVLIAKLFLGIPNVDLRPVSTKGKQSRVEFRFKK